MKHLISYLTALLCAITMAAQPAARDEVTVGAARPDIYMPLLKGKRVGILTNATGRVGSAHTVDLLRHHGADLRVIFTPEHGLRGTADAGEAVASGYDKVTGLPIVSLYGKGVKQRSRQAMDKVDVVVVDLQDVGTRFYTYYITMMQLMNDAAATGRSFVVLDRPNPNGMYVDGPILERKLYSGVGQLPIPVVHGMTLGELAQMITGEGWLDGGRADLDLHVVECLGYTHATRYEPPVAPSPNLRNEHAMLLYPSLCYFEGTPLSVGRGTDHPFECYGFPGLPDMPYAFTPRSMTGAAKPPLMGQECLGRLLTDIPDDSIIARGVDLSHIIDARRSYLEATASKPDAKPFFTKFFDLLIGTPHVREMIEQGRTAQEIRAWWQPAVEDFKELRQPYLIYPEE